jgi:hypothetical protein
MSPIGLPHKHQTPNSTDLLVSLPQKKKTNNSCRIRPYSNSRVCFTMTIVMETGQRVENGEKKKIINPDGDLHKLASP